MLGHEETPGGVQDGGDGDGDGEREGNKRRLRRARREDERGLMTWNDEERRRSRLAERSTPILNDIADVAAWSTTPVWSVAASTSEVRQSASNMCGFR